MMDNVTYIMRYAELLIIHAEATLAGAGSTSDAGALASINAVRNRAGLTSLTSITFLYKLEFSLAKTNCSFLAFRVLSLAASFSFCASIIVSFALLIESQ